MMFKKIAFIGLSALTVAACDSGGSSPAQTPATQTPSSSASTKAQVSLNVVDGKWHYYTLDSLLKTEVTPADEKTDANWDVAFKTTSVKINGGAAGGGALTAALALPRGEYFNPDGSNKLSVYQDGRDPVAEVGLTFDAVTKNTDTSGLTFESPAEKLAISGDWFTGGRRGVTINNDKYWLLRSQGADSYVKFRVTAATFNRSGYITQIKYGMNLQKSSNTSFDGELEQTINFDGTAGDTQCIDIDLATVANASITVDCSTANWDLSVSPNSRATVGAYAMRLNTAARIEGGVKTLAEANAVTNAKSLDDRAWTGEDTVEGVFSKKAWYAYTGSPDHKTLPNYRVYLIKDGADTYKLQVQSYYSESNAARNLLINVEKL